MQIQQLDTTNLFLGIMAVVGALQSLTFLWAGFWLLRAIKDLKHALAMFEMHRVAPLQAEMLTIAHEVRSMAGHADGVAAEVEQTTRRALRTIDSVNEGLGTAVGRSLNEVNAVGSGVARAIGTLFGSSSRRPARLLATADRGASAAREMT